MGKRILLVVTNVDHFEATDEATGIWLSELTHVYDEFARKHYHQRIVSPQGGRIPIDPRSLNWLATDSTTRKKHKNTSFMSLLDRTKSIHEIEADEYDAIFFIGGHGAMWDFLHHETLHHVTRLIYEHGGVVASVCHGYCALLNVRLSEGARLIKNKKLTGFSWREEELTGVAYQVPYNAEQLAKRYGASYKSALIPFTRCVVTDGNLITGQNPASSRRTAMAVIDYLERQSTSK